MASAYSIPTTIDSVVLATSLADYRKTLADNVYQNNIVLKMLSRNKQLIDGGNSIVQPLITIKQNYFATSY